MICRVEIKADKMSAVDEILSYKKNPAEDFYAMLNCDENSSVRSKRISRYFRKQIAGNFLGIYELIQRRHRMLDKFFSQY